MNTNLTVKEVEPMNGKLHLFSIYVDFAASARARKVAVKIAKLADTHWSTSSEMWKFDSIKASGSLQQMAASDAANADVLVVAVSSMGQREPALIEWLEELAVWRINRSASGLLIGLLGDEENHTAELDWTVKSLMHCAHKLGRDFIWHWTGEDSLSNLDWLEENMQDLQVRKLANDNEVVF
jgi:hypothetical protein